MKLQVKSFLYKKGAKNLKWGTVLKMEAYLKQLSNLSSKNGFFAKAMYEGHSRIRLEVSCYEPCPPTEDRVEYERGLMDKFSYMLREPELADLLDRKKNIDVQYVHIFFKFQPSKYSQSQWQRQQR